MLCSTPHSHSLHNFPRRLALKKLLPWEQFSLRGGQNALLLGAQWWELHFRVFYTATGIIGVTEAQLTVSFGCIRARGWGNRLAACGTMFHASRSEGLDSFLMHG